MRLGFYGNMANNNYCAVNALRYIGADAELVLEDKHIDSYLMNRPFWQDLTLEVPSVEAAYAFEKDWLQPAYVRRTNFDPDLAARFIDPAGYPEAQALYRGHFGLDLAADLAILLAGQMGYWPYIQTFSRYDVCFFSSGAIPWAVFCPNPVVVIPTGGDVDLMPFWETVTGFMTRAAYQRADGIFALASYEASLQRLGFLPKTVFLPYVNHPESTPGEGAEALSARIRADWERQTGGNYFILGVCRQNWEWKGNDVLLRAFARYNNPEARLVLMRWGQDIEKSRELAAQLKIEERIIWAPLSSRPSLWLKMRAADVICDQFVMNTYGTSVIEAMYAGKAVIIRHRPNEDKHEGEIYPPFIHAEKEDEIIEAFKKMENLDDRRGVETQSKLWASDMRYSDARTKLFWHLSHEICSKRL